MDSGTKPAAGDDSRSGFRVRDPGPQPWEHAPVRPLPRLLRLLRQHLPHTFFNIRLDPVSIVRQTPAEIRETIIRLVRQSENPWLTGVCCINMDNAVSDQQISAIFDTVNELRKEYQDSGMVE